MHTPLVSVVVVNAKAFKKQDWQMSPADLKHKTLISKIAQRRTVRSQDKKQQT